MHIYRYQVIGLMSTVFANGRGYPVILKTQKWYLIFPCLTLSIIRYESRVKWSNPGKEVLLFPTPPCSSYLKGAFGSPSTTVANFSYFYIYI